MMKDFATQQPLRLDILRGIRDGKLEPLAVYAAYASKNPEVELPRADSMNPLRHALAEWLPVATKCGEKHRAAHKTAINYLEKVSRVDSPVSDLPDILRKLRLQLANDGHPAQFNRIKSSAQAFLRDTVGRNSNVYRDVSAIDKLTEEKQRENNPQSVADVVDLARKIEGKHLGALWGMCLTGMGPKEYFGDWKIERGGLHISGTKRKGRVRDVPVVFPERFAGASGDKTLTTEYRARKFAEALQKASGGRVQPYDLRRTYANWLEDAHIQRTRRRKYLGHAAGDTSDIYEDHEVAEHLAADAAKLSEFIRAGERKTLTLESGNSA
jgi:integrase